MKAFASIQGISQAGLWSTIHPDQHGDWLRQRDGGFDRHISMGSKAEAQSACLFENFSRGLETNRDAWCFNFSRAGLANNMERMIAFYNSEVDRFIAAYGNFEKKAREEKVSDFVNSDPKKISWNRSLKQAVAKGRKAEFIPDGITKSLYRPFTKQWVYFNRDMNAYVNQLPKFFPDGRGDNLLICVSGKGNKVPFSALITNMIPSLHMVDIDGSQCFPLFLYEGADEGQQEQVRTLFDAVAPRAPERRYAITDEGLLHFTEAYIDENISKEDVFYYVYGILHSSEYRERYADNLLKELPRIPRVANAAGFWAFSQAGRELARIHLNYEDAEPYPAAEVRNPTKSDDYRTERMRYARVGKEDDRTTLIYNDRITITGIPLEAYEYVVNGKPALDWVVERQSAKPDKDSGIVNDANDWAVETMNNPRYPLELFLRVITVSLETQKIVKALPPLDIE